MNSIEARLAVEKVPAVAWQDYIDCITSGRAKQAEAKLSKVRVAINEVILTATLRGFTAKLRMWTAVLGEVDIAVRDGTVAAYTIVA